jgi:RNA polymerase sigma-70 factor (ECF subfamily)
LEPAGHADQVIEAAGVTERSDVAGPEVDLDDVEIDLANIVGLYELHGKQVFAFCLRQLKNREDAEDATQLTFLNAFRWSKQNDFRPVNTSILFKIAQNVCLNTKRSSFRRKRVEITSNLEENDGIASTKIYDSDAIIRLPEALRALSAQQRHAIVLREWHGLSYQEIGAELGLSQGAIEGLVFRARRALAGLLNEDVAGRRPADLGSTPAGLVDDAPGDVGALAERS